MDVTSPSSVRSVPGWVSLVRGQAAVRADATKGVLVANKVDLESRRVIGTSEGRELASSLQLEYVEVSAVRLRPGPLPRRPCRARWAAY